MSRPSQKSEPASASDADGSGVPPDAHGDGSGPRTLRDRLRPFPPESHWLLRRRMTVLAAVGLVTLGALALLPRLRFDFSPQQLFETREPDTDWVLWQEMVGLFGRDDGTLFVVLDAGEAGDALTPAVRSWLGRFEQAIAPRADVARVASLASAATVRDVDGEITVGPAADLSREALLADPLLRGTLLSRDGRLSVALVTLADEVTPIGDVTRAVNAVRAWIAENPPPPEVEAHLAGVPVVRVDVVDSIHHSQLVYLPLTAAVMSVLLWLAFRRLSRTLVPLLTVAVAAVWGLAGMALFGVPIDIINHVLPPLVAVIGVSDGLHLMIRDQQEHAAGRPRAQALSISVRTLAVACFLTSFTTAVGFASLATSGTAILMRFGLAVAAAVLMAYVVTLGVLPQGLSFAGPPAHVPGRARTLGGFAVAAGRLGLARPRLTVAVSVALMGALLWVGLARVHVNVRLTEVYPSSHPMPRLQRLIDRELGGVLSMDLVVELEEGDGRLDPDLLARMARLQDWIEAYPEITDARSVVDFVQPLHAALAGPDGGRLPQDRELLAQEWLVAELGDERLPLEHFVAREGGLLRINVRKADVGGRHTLQFAEAVRARVDEVFAGRPDVRIRLTGDDYVASRNMSQLIRDLFTSLALAGAIIFLSLLVLFRSLRTALVSILPNAFPLVAVLGFMGLIGMDLDVGNVVIFSVALGLAVDDTIHVLARHREERRRGGSADEILERTLRTSGQAVALTSLVLGAGILVLVSSDFVPTRRFGYLTALTLAVAFVADVILLPALLRLAYGKNRPREGSPPPGCLTS